MAQEITSGFGNPDKRQQLEIQESKSSERSCFPVDASISSPIVARMIVGESLDLVRSRTIVLGMTTIQRESPALFNSVVDYNLQVHKEGIENSILEESFLGVVIAYTILQEQATANGARFPSISGQVMDAFNQDVDERIGYNKDVPIILEYIEELTESEPGFMQPLREYAPDPEIDPLQFAFLANAVDIYWYVNRAEQADRMIREIGLDEPE